MGRSPRCGGSTGWRRGEVATGKVTDACYPRHRHEEFLRFVRQAAQACPRVPLHQVVDNYATHNHPDVRAWLAKLTRQAIRRGTTPRSRTSPPPSASSLTAGTTLPPLQLDQDRR
jgi:hypothetical protein